MTKQDGQLNSNSEITFGSDGVAFGRDKSIDPERIALSRRTLLKILAAGSTATAVHLALPAEWSPPLVEIGVLPVHAAISQTLEGGDGDGPVDGPTGIVVDETTAYVTNQISHTLDIVDLVVDADDTEEIEKSSVRRFVPYPTAPTATAVMAGKLYVAEGLPGGRGRLSAFSVDHGGLMESLHLEETPTALVAAQGRVYAAGGDKLWIVDAAADILLTTLTGFTNPSALTIDQDRLFVTDGTTKFEIDLLTEQLVGSMPLSGERVQSEAIRSLDDEIAASAVAGGRSYAASATKSVLYAVNPADNQTISLSLPESAGKVLALAPSADRLFMGTDRGQILVLTLATNQIATMTPFKGPGDLVHADGQLFIVNETGNFLSIVSLDEGQVRNVAVGSAPKAVAVADGVAYVTNFGDNSLSVVTLAGTPQVTTVPNVGNGPWGVGILEQDIYVAGHNDNSLWRVRKVNGAYQVTNLNLPNIQAPRHLKTLRYTGNGHDWSRVYVVCSGNNTLQIVDVSGTPAILYSPSVGAGAYDLDFYIPGYILVTCENANLLYRFLHGGDEASQESTGKGPRGVAWADQIRRIIVAAYSDDTIIQHSI